MIPTYKAESLADFIARIKEIREEWDNPKDDDQVGLWFRGLQKSNWPLVPGLYRYLDRKTKYMRRRTKSAKILSSAPQV